MRRARTASTLALTATMLLGATVAAQAQDTGGASTCIDYSEPRLREALRQRPSTISGGTATLRGIPSDACDFSINLSSYELPSGETRPFSDQVLFANTTITVSNDDNGATFSVATPDCAYQVDLYLGPVDDSPPHANELLVAFDANTTSEDGAEACAGRDPGGEPTEEPTDPGDPTDDPTEDPTDDPTEDPTDDPTEDPTDDPTDDPTEEPTGDPTDDPRQPVGGEDDAPVDSGDDAPDAGGDADRNPDSDDTEVEASTDAPDQQLANSGADAQDMAVLMLGLLGAGGLALYGRRRELALND